MIVDSVMCFNNIIKGTKWGISGPKVGILQSKSCQCDVVGLLLEGLQGILWQTHTYTHSLLSTHVLRVTDTLPLAGERRDGGNIIQLYH